MKSLRMLWAADTSRYASDRVKRMSRKTTISIFVVIAALLVPLAVLDEQEKRRLQGAVLMVTVRPGETVCRSSRSWGPDAMIKTPDHILFMSYKTKSPSFISFEITKWTQWSRKGIGGVWQIYDFCIDANSEAPEGDHFLTVQFFSRTKDLGAKKFLVNVKR